MNFSETLHKGDIQAVLSRLQIPATGEVWKTIKSPLRDETNPSFSINPATGAWVDYGSGEKGDVVNLYSTMTGKEEKEAIKDIKEMTGNGVINGTQSKITATYDYVDENEELLFQVVRYEPKDFRQRRPDGKGGYIWGLKDVRRVLYNLPAVKECIENGWLLVLTEGEKDCETLRELGIAATTAPMGANKWRKEHTDQLAGAKLMILPDNDEQGKEHANHVANQLSEVCKELKIIELPDLPDKGDVTDWVQAGGTRQHLLDLWKTTEQFIPVTEDKTKIWEFETFNPMEAPITDIQPVIHGFAARGKITLMGGSGGSGKSLLTQFLLQTRYNDLLQTEPGQAVYLTGADSSEHEIRRRARSIGSGNGLVTMPLPDVEELAVATNEGFMEELADQLRAMDADAVVFDTLADFHAEELNNAIEANKTMTGFRRLAESANVAVILITHTKKGSKIKQRYDIEDVADSRVWGTKSDYVFAIKGEYQDDSTNLTELQCVKSRSEKPLQNVRAKIESDVFDSLNVVATDEPFTSELEHEQQQEQRETVKEKAVQLHESGNSYSDIARQLNRSKGWVAGVLKDVRVDHQPQYEPQV